MAPKHNLVLLKTQDFESHKYRNRGPDFDMLSTCSFWGHLDIVNAQYPFHFKCLTAVLMQTQEKEWQIVQNFCKPSHLPHPAPS